MAIKEGAHNSVAMDPTTNVDATAVRINGGVNNTGKRNAIPNGHVLGWEVYAPAAVNLLVAWGGAFTGTPPSYVFNPGATDLAQNSGTPNATRVPAGGSITLLGDGDIWAVRETGAGNVTANCRAFF